MLDESTALVGEKSSLKESTSGGDDKNDTSMAETPESLSSQTMLLHSKSSQPKLKTYPYLSRPQEVVRWQPWVRLAWILHVLVTVAVMCSGIRSNQNSRKYIPVRSSQNASVFFSFPCKNVFVNALAESETEDGAMVCCPLKPQHYQQSSSSSKLQDQLVESLCRRKSKYFLFANRLARFPDAWLLPLFPLLLRALWLLVSHVVHLCRQHGSSSSTSPSLSSALWGLHRTTLLRRFYFYVLLLSARGWILYLAFNELEDFALGMAARWLPSSSPESSSSSSSCWYKPWFTPTHHQPTPHLSGTSCYGRAFDFSDHIVLYCAQILPIALTEVLYGWMVPTIRWNELTRSTITSSHAHSPESVSYLSQRQRRWEWLPLVSLLGLLYLYLITCWGMFKTAAFFHTTNEILVGYAISLFVQIPLWGILQCSGPRWAAIRLYLFALP